MGKVEPNKVILEKNPADCPHSSQCKPEKKSKACQRCAWNNLNRG